MYSRRSVLQIGSIAALGLTQTDLLNAGVSERDERAVIWVYLDGGISHIESFNPIPEAPDEYRSSVGHINTKVDGMKIGGLFNKVAEHAKNLSIVRSFTHNNADHSLAKHIVMTGHEKGNSGGQSFPAIGSLVSRNYNASDKITGLPVYICNGNIEWDRASFLGAQYDPFNINSDAKKNFLPTVEAQRLQERIHVLSKMDKFQPENRLVKDANELKGLAYNVLFGKAKEAFEFKKEKKETIDEYGPGIGEQLLLARRMIQYGAKFVTANYGGWDTHTNMVETFNNRIPPLDKALSALYNDLERLGLKDKVLVIITSEFGRTPKKNAAASRDHFPKLNTLVFWGGRETSGRLIGESDAKATEPKDNPIYPQDITHTILEHFEIPINQYIKDLQGRPLKIVDKSKNILRS